MAEAKSETINPEFREFLETCMTAGVPDLVAVQMYLHSPTERGADNTFPAPEVGMDRLYALISQYKEQRGIIISQGGFVR